jgi:hypothetical protein
MQATKVFTQKMPSNDKETLIVINVTLKAASTLKAAQRTEVDSKSSDAAFLEI